MNFLISSIGIFEGRGWFSQPEEPYDNNSLVVGYLFEPEDDSLLKALIDDGKFLEKFSENFNFIRIEDFRLHRGIRK
jgi:hypothetical protein